MEQAIPPTLSLSCQCKKMKAKVEPISPKQANHLTCYCSDCQKFAVVLNRDDQVLNEYAGTTIVQVPIAHFKFTDGKENLACLRLTEKGLYRWYAKCCNTPIGNTLNAGWPFIGIIHSFIDDDRLVEKAGEMKGSVHIKEASSRVPERLLGPQGHTKLLLATLQKLALWKLQGKNKPSEFFDSNSQPVVVAQIQAH
ncbi:hypothetical protein HG263_17080 [Pseudoalteromonas sp. JBTF-M23]|uniref:CENP-V/GFA domain-containing protein n=1 Tax=Pseudoalteromonas caenipelagi TaxID=2726988 RepID=A0A849VG94_9GAMM|nr:DUF6151 family protein [Pseudoalteromonas caenipelagi]NOU52245.1 hypothetical protein [Pseudoalteromonas caenipelagi]